MKRGRPIERLLRQLFMTVVIVLGQGFDKAGYAQETVGEKAPAERSLEGAEPSDESALESWDREIATPWLLCAVGGTYHYVQYLLDKSDWNLIPVSEYLEKSECFYRDFEWAADVYRAGARAGKEAHALLLGYLYLNGHGVERNVDKAQRWFVFGLLFQAMATPARQIKHTKWIMGSRGIPPELMDAIRNVRLLMKGDGVSIDHVAKSLWHGSGGMKVNREAAAKLYGIAHHARNRRHEDKIRYWNILLADGFDTRDPKARKFEIYQALHGIYNEATLGLHAPSQKIIAEVFEAGKLVPRDLPIAYVFFRLAQKYGLDVDDKIEKIRPKLTAEQIAVAENDVQEGKQIQYHYRDIRDGKLPPHPYL